MERTEPAAHASAPSTSAVADAERAVAPAPPLILVVDDDPTIRIVLGDVLQDEGYRVAFAADGSEGLARLEQGDIALLLLDLMLPEVDGLEVCQRVRARPDQPYLPIIMLTALTTRTERLEGFAVGADDYVNKPFDVEELLARVRVWLRAGQRQTGSAGPAGAPRIDPNR